MVLPTYRRLPSMMGYLAKNHPRYTHKLTNDIKQAMHFETPNEALAFIKEHSIEGNIIKDPYQEQLGNVTFKYMGENYGEAITYLWDDWNFKRKDVSGFESTKGEG